MHLLEALQVIAEGIAVSAVELCLIERPVGIFKQLVVGIARRILGQVAHTRTAGDAAVVFIKGEGAHLFHQADHGFDQRDVADAFEQNHKLIPAIPREDVFGFEEVGQQLCHILQHAVAEQVAVDIVDLFEIVHIHDDEGAGVQRVFAAEVVFYQFLSGGVVIQPCQRVAFCLLLQGFFAHSFARNILNAAQKHLFAKGGGISVLTLQDLIARLALLVHTADLDRPRQPPAEKAARLPTVFPADVGVCFQAEEIMLFDLHRAESVVIDDKGVCGGAVLEGVQSAAFHHQFELLAVADFLLVL